MTNLFSASFRSFTMISVDLEYPLGVVFHIYEIDSFNNRSVVKLSWLILNFLILIHLLIFVVVRSI